MLLAATSAGCCGGRNRKGAIKKYGIIFLYCGFFYCGDRLNIVKILNIYTMLSCTHLMRRLLRRGAIGDEAPQLEQFYTVPISSLVKEKHFILKHNIGENLKFGLLVINVTSSFYLIFLSFFLSNKQLQGCQNW